MSCSKKILFILLCSTPLLQAHPQGMNSVNNPATVVTSGNTMMITTGKNTILTWDSFSIDSGEIVNIIQAGSQSALLNRVMGYEFSQINGCLKSNGRVYLVNPHGIMIGPEGEVLTNGFIASTLDILDGQFLTGDLVFSGDSSQKIVNLGRIESKGGDIFLLARSVTNKGVIEASGGDVGLASGSKILIKPPGHQRIFIEGNFLATEDEQLVSNEGRIEGLNIELDAQTPYFLAVKNSGELQSIESEERGGRILLVAKLGTIDHTGSIVAPNGEVTLAGKGVELREKALIDTSSSWGGGQINIGGGPKATRDLKIDSESTYLGHDVVLRGDSDLNNAGKISIWSNRKTECDALISAKSEKGRGGIVDISGKVTLTPPSRFVDCSSASRIPGQLTFDPGPVTITTGMFNGPDTWGDAYISGQLASVPVTISTQDPGVTPGTPVVLTVESAVNISWSTPYTLTLIGGDSIYIQDGAQISNTNTVDPNFDALILEGNIGATATGDLNGIYCEWLGGPGASLTSGNGNIRITGVGGSGASAVATSNGVLMSHTIINLTGTGSQAGSLYITGTSGQGIDANKGIDLVDINFSSIDGNILIDGTSTGTGIFQCGLRCLNISNMVCTGTGNIDMTGLSGPGVAGINFGLILEGTIGLTANSGHINLSATSRGHGGPQNTGAFLNSDGVISTSSAVAGEGNITLTAVSGTGSSLSYGTECYTTIQTVAGDILITSTGNAASTDTSIGFYMNESTIQTTGTGANAGNITIVGTGGATDANSVGIECSDLAIVRTVDGDITFTGTAGTATTLISEGILIENGASISSTGNGNLTLTGTSGGAFNTGIGVEVKGLGTAVTATEGDLTVTGTGNADDIGFGINIAAGGSLKGIASASLPHVTITGNGANGSLQACGGIQITGANSQINVSRGIVNVTGTGSGTGSDNPGITLSTGGQIRLGNLTPSSILNVVGTGSPNGTTRNYGIQITNINSLIQNASGTMTVTGRGGGLSGGNSGIYISNAGRINNLGTTAFTVVGYGTTGADSYGIKIDGLTSQIGSSTAICNVIGHSGALLDAILLQNRGTLGSLTSTSRNINITAYGDMDLTSGGRVSTLLGNITIDVSRDLTLTGASTNTAITPNNAVASVSVGRDLTLTCLPVGTNQTAVIGSFSALGGGYSSTLVFPFIGGSVNLITNSNLGNVAIGHLLKGAILAPLTGSITFQDVVGDVIVQGANLSGPGGTAGRAQIGHMAPVAATYFGDISINCRGNIKVLGGTASGASVARIGHGSSVAGTYTPSNNTLLAGNNFIILSAPGAGQAEVINNNGNLVVVVDNDFPTFPNMGSGGFSIASTISAVGNLQIYTVQPNQNNIDDPINGATFTEAPFNVNTDNQIWNTYYPNGPLSGGAFTLYYKVGQNMIDYLFQRDADALYYLQVAESQLDDLLPLYRYMRLPLFPYYRAKMCSTMKKESKKERECIRLFNPYLPSEHDDVYRVD